MTGDNPEILDGSCLCGAIRFRAQGVDTAHHACHCKMCRRWSGGPFMAAQVERMVFDGEAPETYTSSEWAERGFCGKCGSTLYYRLKDSGESHVSVGAFDEDGPFALALEVFIDHKPDGYALAGERPRWTEKELMEKIGGGG